MIGIETADCLRGICMALKGRARRSDAREWIRAPPQPRGMLVYAGLRQFTVARERTAHSDPRPRGMEGKGPWPGLLAYGTVMEAKHGTEPDRPSWCES
jgi:hypothetical protein